MTMQHFLPAILVLSAGLGRAESQEFAKPLYEAIRNGQLTAVRSLLKNADVNLRDKRGATPLMYAAAIGNAEALALLLNAGADVNARNDFDASALIWAAGDPVKSRILIEHGADVNAASKQGRRPLMMAARRDGNVDLVRLLLSKGALPDVRDARGNTALMYAAQAGDADMMRVLTDRGADLNAANAQGATPLGNAVCSNRAAAVKFLLGKGAKPDAAIASLATVRHGPVALGNLTPLMAAAPYGSAELIGALLKAGADVNARDLRGMTPLMLAVASETQDIDVVKLLLQTSADPNVKSKAGETALDWANRYGSRPVIAALERAGARAGTSDSPTPAVVTRAPLRPPEALNQSLKLLLRSGTEYFQESGCAGCHHQILTAVAVRAARTAGVRIDDEAAREQMTSMKVELGSQQEQFLQGIDLFGPQLLVPYLFGLAEAGYAPDAITDSAVADLMSLQSADGSWNRGLAISRAPIQESNISRTAQSLRVLRAYGPPARQNEIDNRVARARAWLLEARPRTGDEHAMLLAGLWWSGAGKEKVKRAAQSLLAQQRGDGGWGGNPNLSSDAFSTGEALYALHESGCVGVHDRAYERGIEFLLRTQHDDGAWYVRSRAVKLMPYFESGFPFGDDQWISAAGTAWASLALAPAVEDRTPHR